MIHIDVVLGTRPEITKSAQIVQALIQETDVNVQIFMTGQHTEIASAALNDLGIAELCKEKWLSGRPKGPYEPDWYSNASNSLRQTLSRERPNIVIVIGDTLSALLGAYVASESKIPVFHVEAGIRLKKPTDLDIEDSIRRKISKYAFFHFTPTPREKSNLLAEGIQGNQISVVGDLSIGSCSLTYERIPLSIKSATTFREAIANLGITQTHLITLDDINEWNNGFVLSTLHRRSSLEYQDRLESWIRNLIHEIQIPIFILCSRPDTRWERFYRSLQSESRFRLIKHLSPTQFQLFLKYASCVITDSAGVQQESLLLGKGVIAMRSEVDLYENHKQLRIVSPPFNRVTNEHAKMCRQNASWEPPKKNWRDFGLRVAKNIVNKIQKGG